MSPAMLRAFCARLGIPEKPAATVLRACVKAAVHAWPKQIAESGITQQQKARLLAHFERHPHVRSLRRRSHAPHSTTVASAEEATKPRFDEV